ncbi:GOLPH3/VPS74 family protein [Phytohabitans houttuyneae]|uniref:GPP34 family phosphoprotein n=1 Tax=Phytohabitans houttuyneae TaxID=1076126 RepID=A0A6V8KFR7_9ACTN|nr:GPP34 family phosphoprotein [Phytohabitans houttuyneae]GFJ81218.1 hypothetical protein Phou_053980 [Phytohabitans houttuyneae]
MELPERMFLLAYDSRRQRLARWIDVGLLVRAAALAELELRGVLVDERGRATLASSRRPEVTESLLREVLAEVGASAKPRRWQYWTERGRGKARAAVERRLVAARIISVERRRVFGIFPARRIVVRDRRLIDQLHARVAEALRARTVDSRDAATVALAAAGQLRTVFGWRQRRANRKRIAELTKASVPAAAKGLQKAIAAKYASSEGGG